MIHEFFIPKAIFYLKIIMLYNYIKDINERLSCVSSDKQTGPNFHPVGKS